MRYGEWPRYVPVAERRRKAAKKLAQLTKAGRVLSPVEITGRKITTTYWGDAWCQNLESYSDFANRLPRGRTYVRNGSVVDLQIDAGKVKALVSGSALYKVELRIDRLKKKRWRTIKEQCAGKIDSLLELLSGSISKGVMEIVSRKGVGLFPAPEEIVVACSCPDWAILCKHVAAVIYGVGARLDQEPKLLFTLRGADPAEMVDTAIEQSVVGAKARSGRVLLDEELSSVFGVDIDSGASEAQQAATDTRRSPATKTKHKAETETETETETGTKRRSTTRKAETETGTKRTSTRRKAETETKRRSTRRRSTKRKTETTTKSKRATAAKSKSKRVTAAKSKSKRV